LIAKNIDKTLANTQVLNALRHKVSRERVAQELKQMLNHTPHTHALVSICLLYSLNLLPTVFSFPPADTIVVCAALSPACLVLVLFALAMYVLADK
jgi:tRNA nucleotidyltransferase/poly(A) polymerase